MQPRGHRMRRQARRESARAWIASGAAVTIKTYARRYGVDRYTAYEDLSAIGFPLPDAAQRWAHRPPPQARPRRSSAPRALPDNDWIMMDGRPYFVAGYTAGGAPYGIYLDEMDDDYLTGMITPGRPARPGWQVLAGAMPGWGSSTEILYEDDPFGVFYLVAWLARVS
jgi:hypothetical protein